ncbi:MAG TPA: hypothetical protein VJG90_02395 [Candidatus Nanoarchaeia archaeon]|nr:hypothetical protein [Candidatus Nanoarchaeia archaeon]
MLERDKAEIFSYLYRKARSQLIQHNLEKHALCGEPPDLEEVIETGDRLLKKLPRWTYRFSIPQGIGVQLYDLHFPSPLTLASFKSDMNVIDLWMQLGLGGGCVKTLWEEARSGNPRPRIQEIQIDGHSALINAMRFPGPGLGKSLDELDQADLYRHHKPIGISLGGNNPEEYRRVFLKIISTLTPAQIALTYFELDISSPATPEVWAMAHDPSRLYGLLHFMREHSSSAIGVKLSPDMEDKQLLAFANELQVIPKTYLNLGNTAKRRCEEAGIPRSWIHVGSGGISGPPIYARTREMVNLVAPTGIHLMATGGIDSAEKVEELTDLIERHQGHRNLVVGMATAIVQDMYCIPRINYKLAERKST